MSKRTQEELDRLGAATTEAEWNAACDAVKKAHGGYPEDWYGLVVLSGLARRAQERFREGSK